MPPGALDRDRRRPRMAFVSFWKPLALTTEQLEAGSHFLNPVGRLKPGVSIDACTDHAGTSVFGGRATTRTLLRPLTY